MKVVKITFNAETGEEIIEEVDVPDEKVTLPQITKININDIAKLIEFAKKMGWIR
jgi:hypothetical protein